MLKGLLASTALSVALSATTNVYGEAADAGGGGAIPVVVRETILNDTFDANIDGWIDSPQTTSSWVATGGGRLRVFKSVSGLFSAYKSFPTEVGKYYTVTATMAARHNNGYVTVANGSASYNDGGELARPLNNVGAGVTGSATFAGTGNLAYIHALNATFTSTWIELDNISVVEITPVTIFNDTFDANVDNWAEQGTGILTWQGTGRLRVQSPNNAQGAYREFDTVSGNSYVLKGSKVAQSGGFGYLRRETVGGANLATIIDSNAVVTGSNTFVGDGNTQRVHVYSYSNFWHEFDDISLIDLGPL